MSPLHYTTFTNREVEEQYRKEAAKGDVESSLERQRNSLLLPQLTSHQLAVVRSSARALLLCRPQSICRLTLTLFTLL